MNYQDRLQHRLTALEEKYSDSLFTAPPNGVACDCDGFDTEHFHVRCMAAECDTCGAELRQDFFAYTRAEAFTLLFAFAEKNGWSTDLSRNSCICPECVETAAQNPDSLVN